MLEKAVMANSRNEAPDNRSNRKQDQPRITDGPDVPGSMDDNVNDEERLKQDASYIILPDVSDIPGQENITGIGPLGEMADTTISSDDEEGVRDGKDLLAEENDDLEIVMGTEADVTDEELLILVDKNKDMDGGDDELISNEGLDDTDFDGEPLNEATADMDTTGDDLDIPEADGDNPANDALGQGDEENNYYSLGSDDNDNITEGTP